MNPRKRDFNSRMYSNSLKSLLILLEKRITKNRGWAVQKLEAFNIFFFGKTDQIALDKKNAQVSVGRRKRNCEKKIKIKGVTSISDSEFFHFQIQNGHSIKRTLCRTEQKRH